MKIERSADRVYHHELTVGQFVILFRWYPIVYWRFFPRAWQAPAPHGFIAASDWTGRERELIGWFWPHEIRAVSVDPVIMADEARMAEPVRNWLDGFAA